MSNNELFQNLNETQEVQRIMLALPVTDEGNFSSSIPYIATLAGVQEGIVKKTLHTADCTVVKRTGGPIAYRKENILELLERLLTQLVSHGKKERFL